MTTNICRSLRIFADGCKRLKISALARRSADITSTYYNNNLYGEKK